MTDFTGTFEYEARLRGKHAEKLRHLQRLSEDCVFATVNRTDVVAVCAAAFPECTVHPYTLSDAVLMSCMDRALRSGVRHHLATTLICTNSLNRYYNVANVTAVEPVVTLMTFAPYDRPTMLRALARLHVPLDVRAIADAVRKRSDVPTPRGWKFQGVSVGTRVRRDVWVNPVYVKDTWCHNYIDQDLQERDAHVYTTRVPRDPVYRRFVVRSVVDRAQTYLIVEVPVVFYYTLPNGMQYAYVRGVQVCRMCLVEKEDPMHALRDYTTAYHVSFHAARLTSLTLRGMARFYVILFNDGTGRPHVAGAYAALAHGTSHAALCELDAFDPTDAASKTTDPTLRAVRDAVSAMTVEYRRTTRDVYRATVDALIASYMMSPSAPHVTFVTPFTIEDHTV
jgi:hypothetical protein